jgi:hypothetical protein
VLGKLAILKGQGGPQLLQRFQAGAGTLPEIAENSMHRFVRSASTQQVAQFHRATAADLSGTFGRQGFGEDPSYPEGPGNLED